MTFVISRALGDEAPINGTYRDARTCNTRLMSIAPAPQLAACLEVLYHATIEARTLGWKGQQQGLTNEECERLARLMNAVHNLPHLIAEWERCNESDLRHTLATFDKQFRGDLLATYERVVAERTQSS